MPDRLTPSELRERAREHREGAARDPNPTTRQGRLTLADEYERLAAAMEAESAKGHRNARM